MVYTQGSQSYFDNISDFYSNALSLEIATLQRRIILPLLPREKISSKVLVAYDELGYDYNLAQDVYGDVVGNFFVPMLNPLVEGLGVKSVEMEFEPPSTENILNEDSGLETVPYVERNYINLVIPKHMTMNFRKTIPVGTQFIVGFVGGSGDINSIRILAVAGRGEEYNPEDYELQSLVGYDQETVTEIVAANIEAAIAEYEAMLEEERKEYG